MTWFGSIFLFLFLLKLHLSLIWFFFVFFSVFFPSYLRQFLSTPIIDLRVALFFSSIFFSLVGAITHFRSSARRPFFFPSSFSFSVRTYHHPTFVLLFHLL